MVVPASHRRSDIVASTDAGSGNRRDVKRDGRQQEFRGNAWLRNRVENLGFAHNSWFLNIATHLEEPQDCCKRRKARGRPCASGESGWFAVQTCCNRNVTWSVVASYLNLERELAPAHDLASSQIPRPSKPHHQNLLDRLKIVLPNVNYTVRTLSNTTWAAGRAVSQSSSPPHPRVRTQI